MTIHSGQPDELVPLAIGFDASLWGFRRDQVRHYVHDAEFELRTTAADRDAALVQAERLRRHLEAARAENRRLRTRVDRMCRRPLSVDAAGDLARRVVELAHEEADQITTQARAAAEQSWAQAAAAGGRLARRHQWLLGELDARRRAMEREHRELVENTVAHLTSVTLHAERRRRELDECARQQRDRIEADFTAAMSVRRAEALRRVADQESATAVLAAERDAVAAAKAAEVVRRAIGQRDAAMAQAARAVREAAEQVSALRTYRDRVLAELRAVQDVLSAAAAVAGPVAPRPRTPADTARALPS
ncbi:hypothetical protein ABZ816_19470 [Actinosynnema sp. NPDC047251]|nr:hypothetical protein [Saccharothrix espanaensis]